MKTTIAVLSDIHYNSNATLHTSNQPLRAMEILLQRAVQRLNYMIRPDVTLVLGDIVDDGAAPHALDDLRRVRAILDRLESPCVVIPGNHDPAPDAFFTVFDRPPAMRDIGGVRIVAFMDPEEPGYNARRAPHDIERMAQARAGFDEFLVTAQHVPLYPAGTTECPYHYTNSDTVLGAMRRHGFGLSVSGHYHRGFDLVQDEGACYSAAPALCELPFSFLEITIEDGVVSVHRHALRLPEHLALVDLHAHTQFAYCGVNMDIAQARAFAQVFGLAGLAFTEHSGQLYFDDPTYWSDAFLGLGIEYPEGRANRMEAYFEAAARFQCPPQDVALEVDCDLQGRPVIREEDRQRASFLLGAVHVVDALKRTPLDIEVAFAEYLGRIERFAQGGIAVLAHPFRVFQRSGIEPPRSLLQATVDVLRRHGVAAEINLHTRHPQHPLVRACLDAGVKLTFGSDAHNLFEVGELSPHIALLRACEYDGDFQDILLDPRRR